LRHGSFNEHQYAFREHRITGDNNCGFTGLGPDRDVAIGALLQQAGNKEIRQIVNLEIMAALHEHTLSASMGALKDEGIKLWITYDNAEQQFSHKAGSIKERILKLDASAQTINQLDPFQLLEWLHQHPEEYIREYEELSQLYLAMNLAHQNSVKWVERDDVFIAFLESYLSKYGRLWLTFIPNNNGKAVGIIDAIVKIKNIPGICIWARREEGEELFVVHHYGNIDQATHLIHDGVHFNLLLENIGERLSCSDSRKEEQKDSKNDSQKLVQSQMALDVAVTGEGNKVQEVQKELQAVAATEASPASFWHFRCKNHSGATFLGKSRASREAAEQALKRHQERKHGELSEGVIEQTAENHPKILYQQ